MFCLTGFKNPSFPLVGMTENNQSDIVLKMKHVSKQTGILVLKAYSGCLSDFHYIYGGSGTAHQEQI